MSTLRWISFIPAAFIVAIVLGALGHWFGDLFGSAWFELGEATAWVTSGLVSAVAFIVVGLKVAPIKSDGVKWALVIILFLLGAISAIGAFLAEDDRMAGIAGAIMVCVAIGAAKTPVHRLVF